MGGLAAYPRRLRPPAARISAATRANTSFLFLWMVGSCYRSEARVLPKPAQSGSPRTTDGVQKRTGLRGRCTHPRCCPGVLFHPRSVGHATPFRVRPSVACQHRWDRTRFWAGQPCSCGSGWRAPSARRHSATVRYKASSDQRAPILDTPTLSGHGGCVGRGVAGFGCRWRYRPIVAVTAGWRVPLYESAAIPNRSRANCPREVFWAGNPRAVACSQATIAASDVAYTSRLGPSDPWQ